ncbi:MAG TPA: FAD-dependent oxidoreductase [Cyclobacteriaceae bacterium]|nr:FAD-dependent oxidoreductase [Cyclobacteriaceae bacterium]
MSLPTFNPVEHAAWGVRLPALSRQSHVVVVGAGVFGAWTALFLRKKGLRVTLLDGHGVANNLASSGDESRILRASYGNNKLYFDLCLRAKELWLLYEQKWETPLFVGSGVLWLCPEQRIPLLDDAMPLYKNRGLRCEYLSIGDMVVRYPMINTEGLHHGVLDPSAGFLLAQSAMRRVVEEFVQIGGEFIQRFAIPGYVDRQIQHLDLSDGSKLHADAYIFATGPWLGQQFPEVLGERLSCSQQEVFYFEIPKGLPHNQLPAWLDADGKVFFYGIPGSPSGFKIGVDRRGPPLDPNQKERIGSSTLSDEIRKYLAHRFPDLAQARIHHHRICPYENASDGNFIAEGHPEQQHVVLLGGGSGHGFKHGPALGEWMANQLLP